MYKYYINEIKIQYSALNIRVGIASWEFTHRESERLATERKTRKEIEVSRLYDGLNAVRPI